MSIVIGVVVFIAIVVILLLLLASRQPDEFRVERSITINAAPAKIAALIDDFHAWSAWSPWEKIDPSMTRTFGGAGRGPGATYAWSGNGKAGAGRMEILESSPLQVRVKLDFEKPFEGHNITDFTLAPSGQSTGVTWTMYGPNTFIGKVMGMVVNMDKMIGKDFEAGLANMKAAAES
jgi:hypothetical protein